LEGLGADGSDGISHDHSFELKAVEKTSVDDVVEQCNVAACVRRDLARSARVVNQ
jgi:hypothetical protein